MALTLEKLREILCRHDASLPTLCANEVLQAAAEAPTYPLPDSLYPGSKDWMASNYAGRVEWLHVMYESAKRTIAMLDGAPAAAEAQAVNTSESYERMRRALTIIANWTLPETGEYWDKERTRPVSYEAEHGSNGVRDYMKNLAAQTLLATPTDSAVNAGAVPYDAIVRTLDDAMSAAVANGANSVSMPDYMVEVAAWIAAKADSVAPHKSTDLSDNARSASEVSDNAVRKALGPHPDAIDLAPGIERMEQTRNAYEGGKLLAQAAGAMHTDPDPSGDNPWHDKPKADSTERRFTNELGNAIRITIEGPNSTSENILTPMEGEQLRQALNEHADSTEAPAVSDDKTDHEWVEFCRPFVYMNGSHEMPNYPGICRAVLALRPKAQPLTFEQWWRDHGQFTRIAETEPADGEFEQALARAAWDAAHGIASSTKEGNGPAPKEGSAS